MKKIMIFIALAILMLSLVACSNTPSNDKSNATTESSVSRRNEQFTMESIGDSGVYIYIRDVVTDVMYLKYKGGYAGGLTVMLDPETGLPLTYTRYIEIYEAASAE